MIIYMTDEQAQRLGKHLRSVKKQMERDFNDDRNISWTELAKKLEMDDSLLAQLGDGTRKGMTADTLAKLVIGFGPEVLRILGIDPNAKPLFGPKGQGG